LFPRAAILFTNPQRNAEKNQDRKNTRRLSRKAELSENKMKILEKRPLALILCIMLGGFSFFIDFSWTTKLICSAVSLLIIALIYLFDNLKAGRKPIVIISLVAFCISMLFSILWSSRFFPIEHFNSNVTVEARVYDIDNSESTTSVIVCKTEKINGSRDNHKFIAYVDKEISVRIRKYDIIKFTADVNELTNSDDSFDGRSYYVSKGYSALINNFDNLEIIGNKVDKIDLFFDNLRLKISNTFKLRTDFETGAFLTALIIGDRSDLSGNAKLNFSRLGITHILALSGMHLAMLCIAAEFVFKRLNVKKKSRIIAMILLVIGYTALTGFIAPILRSAVMLIFSYTLFLICIYEKTITYYFIPMWHVFVCTVWVWRIWKQRKSQFVSV
jgi:predicted membrane metal-binding protein